MYETNNTFVTWNTHINSKNIYGHITLYPKRQTKNI